NIDQNQKARNSEGSCNGAIRQPVRDEVLPRGRLLSLAKPWSDNFRSCNPIGPGSRAFVNRRTPWPTGSATHRHSKAHYGSNILHLLLAEIVEAKRQFVVHLIVD